MSSDFETVRQRLLEERKKTGIRPKVGLLPTGHFRYWPQFPQLKGMGLKMY